MKLDPGIYIAMHSVLSLKPGVTEERQKEWLAMVAEVSGWRQSRGRRGKVGALAWAIGSIPRAYAGNICPPPQTRHNRPEGDSTPCGLPADTYGKHTILRSSFNATPRQSPSNQSTNMEAVALKSHLIFFHFMWPVD